MTIYVVLLFLIISSVSAGTIQKSVVDSTFNSKIVGGYPVLSRGHPYQVSLRRSRDSAHFCGGAIIAREWVVTAAHCVVGKYAGDMIIVVGSNWLNSGGCTYRVLEIHSHQYYQPAVMRNDIALLRVEPIRYETTVQPIPIEFNYLDGEETCVITGWGKTFHPGSGSDFLKVVELSTITYRECADRLYLSSIFETQICTFTRHGEGTCHGDSGGPLVRYVNGKPRLLGVVSWGQPCANGYPDVYTRTSAYASWMNGICNFCLYH